MFRRQLLAQRRIYTLVPPTLMKNQWVSPATTSGVVRFCSTANGNTKKDIPQASDDPSLTLEKKIEEDLSIIQESKPSERQKKKTPPTLDDEQLEVLQTTFEADDVRIAREIEEADPDYDLRQNTMAEDAPTSSEQIEEEMTRMQQDAVGAADVKEADSMPTDEGIGKEDCSNNNTATESETRGGGLADSVSIQYGKDNGRLKLLIRDARFGTEQNKGMFLRFTFSPISVRLTLEYFPQVERKHATELPPDELTKEAFSRRIVWNSEQRTVVHFSHYNLAELLAVLEGSLPLAHFPRAIDSELIFEKKKCDGPNENKTTTTDNDLTYVLRGKITNYVVDLKNEAQVSNDWNLEFSSRNGVLRAVRTFLEGALDESFDLSGQHRFQTALRRKRQELKEQGVDLKRVGKKLMKELLSYDVERYFWTPPVVPRGFLSHVHPEVQTLQDTSTRWRIPEWLPISRNAKLKNPRLDIIDLGDSAGSSSSVTGGEGSTGTTSVEKAGNLISFTYIRFDPKCLNIAVVPRNEAELDVDSETGELVSPFDISQRYGAKFDLYEVASILSVIEGKQKRYVSESMLHDVVFKEVEGGESFQLMGSVSPSTERRDVVYSWSINLRGSRLSQVYRFLDKCLVEHFGFEEEKFEVIKVPRRKKSERLAHPSEASVALQEAFNKSAKQTNKLKEALVNQEVYWKTKVADLEFKLAQNRAVSHALDISSTSKHSGSFPEFEPEDGSEGNYRPMRLTSREDKAATGIQAMDMFPSLHMFFPSVNMDKGHHVRFLYRPHAEQASNVRIYCSGQTRPVGESLLNEKDPAFSTGPISHGLFKQDSRAYCTLRRRDVAAFLAVMEGSLPYCDMVTEHWDLRFELVNASGKNNTSSNSQEAADSSSSSSSSKSGIQLTDAILRPGNISKSGLVYRLKGRVDGNPSPRRSSVRALSHEGDDFSAADERVQPQMWDIEMSGANATQLYQFLNAALVQGMGFPRWN